MKYLPLLLIVLLCSCANSKTFVDKDGKFVYAEPYGWANTEARKNDKVIYEASTGNVIWSVVGIETLVVPIWLTGWQLYEPVRLKDEYAKP